MTKLRSASANDVLDDEENTELTELCGGGVGKKSILIKKEQTSLMGIGVGLMATGVTGSGFHTVTARSTTSVNDTSTPSTSTGRHCTFAPTTVMIHSPKQTREIHGPQTKTKSSLKQITPSITLQRPASSYSIGDNLSGPKDSQISTSSSRGGSLTSVHIIE